MSVEPASHALDRVVDVLDRIVPVAAAIRRGRVLCDRRAFECAVALIVVIVLAL